MRGAKTRSGLALLVLAAAAFAAGVGLAVVGAAVGLLAMVGLPVVAGLMVLAYLRPLLAAALVFAALPVGLLALPGTPLGLQVVHLVVMGCSAAVVLRRVAAGQPPLHWSRPMLWAAAFTAWVLLATLSAVDPAAALKQDANLLAGLVLALVLLTVVRDAADVRLLCWVLLGAGTAITAPSLLTAGELGSAYGGAVVNNRLQGTFSQPNELGAFAMLLVLVGFGLLLGSRSRRERALVSLALLPALGALCLSLSRGAWVGAVLAGVALLVLLPRARVAVLTVGIPFVLLGAALGSFAPDQPQVQVVGARLSSFDDPGGNPYDGRPRIWAEARREVVQEPWTGYGPGAFPVVSARAASGAQTVRPDHAHSLLLTVAAEAGLPAAGLLVGLVLAVALAVRSALQRLAAHDGALVAGLAAAGAGVAGQGLVDFVQRNPVLLMSHWAVLGLLLGAARTARAGTPGGRAAVSGEAAGRRSG